MPKVQQVIPNHFSPRVACRDDNREAKRSRAGDWKVAVRGFAVVAVLALRERRPHSADGTKQRNGYAAALRLADEPFHLLDRHFRSPHVALTAAIRNQQTRDPAGGYCVAASGCDSSVPRMKLPTYFFRGTHSA